MNAVLMKDFLNAGEVSRIRDVRWSRIHPELLPIAPQPPMPIAGFYPPSMTFTEGETVSIQWTAGGLDADSLISHYEVALDTVVDGLPGGIFQAVSVEDLDVFGGGKITIARPEDGEYEVWIRAVDDQGTTGFLQEPFHLKVDTQPPPQPHSIQLIEETETRLNIEAVFPEDPTSGLAFMKYALGSGSSDPAELPWTSLFSWNAEDPGASIGDLWVQPRLYADGAWTLNTDTGSTAILPDTYLYVFWDDAYYNGKELDLFLQAWSPQPNRVGIWYVELPGGPEYFRFTDPVAVPLREEWGWVRLPIPAHSGDGNGADLARLQGFESGLLIAGMTARLRDGRVRFSCPRPDPYQTGIWLQSVDAAGWSSDPGFLRWPWANTSTGWALH
jgi:hypothetical protein